MTHLLNTSFRDSGIMLTPREEWGEFLRKPADKIDAVNFFGRTVQIPPTQQFGVQRQDGLYVSVFSGFSGYL